MDIRIAIFTALSDRQKTTGLQPEEVYTHCDVVETVAKAETLPPDECVDFLADVIERAERAVCYLKSGAWQKRLGSEFDY